MTTTQTNNAAEPATPVIPSSIRGHIVTRSLNDIEPETIQWLWPDRIALGKLTILVGQPGQGKSFLMLDIAARVSAGLAWPNQPESICETGDVLLLTAEDDPADTLVPRVMALGGERSRIHIIEAVKKPDPESGEVLDMSFCLQTHLRLLEDMLEQKPEIKLVGIDPVTSYMGNTKENSNAEVRSVLTPLIQLAAKYNVAVLAISHFNKGGSGAINRTIGSTAFNAVARMVWSVVPDREDPKRRLLIPIKSNIAQDHGGLAFRIVDQPNKPAPVVQWEDATVNMTADEALAELGQYEEQADRRDAETFIIKLLDDGPMMASDVMHEARANGFSQKQLNRASRRAGVKKQKLDFNKGWQWSLETVKPTKNPEDSQQFQFQA